MTKRQSELFPELPSDKKYVSDYPNLVAEWHPTKNGNLLPEDVSFGSIKKIWWLCRCGHEWLRNPNGRTSKNNGCPECKRRTLSIIKRQASPNKNLKTECPHITKEWCDEKNVNPPTYYMPGSSDKVWWKCENGHQWQATIASRARLNTGCPYCSGRYPSPDRNLATLHPNIATEWNEKKNGISADKISFGSDNKYWWICDQGHDWKASPNARTSKGTGCPECANLHRSDRSRKATEELNLQTQFPDLCSEWHNIKNAHPPTYYMPGSSDKVWWKCQKGHEWMASIGNRTSQKTGCPYCSGKRASEMHNFAVAFPELIKEWHPNKNTLSPEKYTPRSNSIVWWQCINGHEWKSSISNRATRGCPKCSNQTSKNEIRILTELQSIFDDVRSRERIGGWEVDIFIPELKLAVEYDGYYWHKDQSDRENKKEAILHDNKVRLLRIRERPLEATSQTNIFISRSALITKLDMNKIVCQICSKTVAESYLKNEIFINEKVYKKYLSHLPSPFPEHSLKYNYPKLSKEWHPTKNHPLTPRNFAAGSNQKIWWLCKNGHEWETPISKRALRGDGCAKCSGRKATEKRNFATQYPQLLKYWHPIKNGTLQPTDLTPRSGKKVWWRCIENSHHEWQVAINNITQPQRKLGYCPYCSGTKKSSQA